MGRVAHLWRDGGRSLSEGEPDLAPRKQGRRDSNPRPTVLETAALPTELRPWARRIVAPRFGHSLPMTDLSQEDMDRTQQRRAVRGPVAPVVVGGPVPARLLVVPIRRPVLIDELRMRGRRLEGRQ